MVFNPHEHYLKESQGTKDTFMSHVSYYYG